MLKIERIFCPRKLFSGSNSVLIPLPKNLSRKIARFFVSKIGPATEEEEEGTGVTSDVVKVKGEDPATPGLLP